MSRACHSGFSQVFNGWDFASFKVERFLPLRCRNSRKTSPRLLTARGALCGRGHAVPGYTSLRPRGGSGQAVGVLDLGLDGRWSLTPGKAASFSLSNVLVAKMTSDCELAGLRSSTAPPFKAHGRQGGGGAKEAHAVPRLRDSREEFRVVITSDISVPT